jgi:ArsR family metal-binding transcriptional regulator
LVYYFVTESGRKISFHILETLPSDSPISSTDSAILDLEPKYHVDLEPLDIWKKTPMMNAEECGHQEIIKILKSALRRKSIT